MDLLSSRVNLRAVWKTASHRRAMKITKAMMARMTSTTIRIPMPFGSPFKLPSSGQW
jgi:hypothetical protein